MMFTKLLVLLFTFLLYMVVHDVFVKAIYCKWKKRKNNGFICYFWNCKNWNDCPYNGSKRRFKIFK